MYRVLNVSRFSTFQYCQYARALNFHSHTGFTYFCKYGKVLNMRRNALVEGFPIFHDSECASFLYMPGLHKVLNMPEYG